MNESVLKKVHWSFWLIAILTLIWYAMGVMNYLMRMSANVPASIWYARLAASKN